MAKTVVDLTALPVVENPGRIAILQSKWYPEIVEAMSAVCRTVLAERGFDRLETHTLPGSLELPLAAADLLAEDSQREIDAVICFGVIVKGETLHFEMIASRTSPPDPATRSRESPASISSPAATYFTMSSGVVTSGVANSG